MQSDLAVTETPVRLDRHTRVTLGFDWSPQGDIDAQVMLMDSSRTQIGEMYSYLNPIAPGNSVMMQGDTKTSQAGYQETIAFNLGSIPQEVDSIKVILSQHGGCTGRDLSKFDIQMSLLSGPELFQRDLQAQPGAQALIALELKRAGESWKPVFTLQSFAGGLMEVMARSAA